MSMTRRRPGPVWSAITLLLIAALLAGCGASQLPSAQSSAGTRSTSAAGKTSTAEASGAQLPAVEISIQNFAFSPASLTVPPGTRIVFINEDPTIHNVVQGTASEVAAKDHKPLFASPDLAEGDRWELVLDKPGEYAFTCTIAGHYLLGMTGVIHVVEGAPYPGDAGAGHGEAATATSNPAAHGHAQHAASGSGEPSVPAELGDGLVALPEGLVALQPFRVEGNVKEFALDIQEVQHELTDGVVVTAWAFNGTVPGPVLRVEEGDIVRVHFTNTHHQPHTIHWHGIYTEQQHDGVPHTSRSVMPGETYVYEFVAENAGTYIYHCHVDSYRHIDMGMYGAVIIEPRGEATWDREYTLILDDWDSEIEPLATQYDPVPNHFLINGKAFPSLPMLPLVVGETTRVRLINIGYSNVAMHLHGPSFEVVATDGHPLPQPYRKDTIDVAPGERYEIEITPSKAGLYPFHAHNIQYVRNNGSYPGGMHLMFEILPEGATP